MITRRALVMLGLLAQCAAGCAEAPPPKPPPHPAPIPVAPPPARPPAPAPPPAASTTPSGPLRAVFQLSDPSRAVNLRGLENARRALEALGSAPGRFILVVHGQALGWFRRAEADNLAAPVAALLSTGKVELRVCARTLEENHWQLADIVPGASSVPSGSLEVLRLEREGFAYFKP